MDSIPLDIPLKQCNRCKQFKSATRQFYQSDKSKPDGLSTRCKVCISEARKELRLNPLQVFESVPEGYKRCTKCGEVKPMTSEYFQGDRTKKDGFDYNCKTCAYTPHPRKYKSPVPASQRTCTTCGFTKLLTEFNKHIRSVDGYRTSCRECEAKYEQRYRKENAKRVKEGQQKWYQRNRERMRQYRKEHYNPNAAREKNKRWRKNNPEKVREQRRRHRLQYPNQRREQRNYRIEYYRAMGQARSQRYRVRHPERVREAERRCYYKTDRSIHNKRAQQWRNANIEYARAKGRIRQNKRRALKKGVSGTHTPPQIQEQLRRQHYRCYYARCGFSKFPRVRKNGQWKYLYHVEHTFPLSRVVGTDIPANDMGYIVLACQTCNDSKGSRFPWEWPEGGRLL